MSSQLPFDKYLPTIGIECHVQLKTKTKLFTGISNDARDVAPNELTSPICLGMPGTLPILNRAAVELAIKAGLALNAEINLFSKFDRKHYFYPDLPLGYQITQFDQPIVGKGKIDIPLEGESFSVRINRAHLEADAGKSIHPVGADYSLIDLNRAGTPLLEIVSEPDIHSAKQARAYAQELYLLMKYADVSDVDLYHGNMRFDVNVSVAKKGSKKLGTRSEVKNLNSFRSVEKAVDYEIARQIKELDKGNEIVQETRGWDDSKMRTSSQRGKEDSHDYRYFPDPDLPPVIIDKTQIDEIKNNLPMLPAKIRQKMASVGIDLDQVQIILSSSKFAEIMLLAIEEDTNPNHIRRIANWLTTTVQAESRDDQEVEITFVQLEQLSELVEADKLSSSAAKTILVEMLSHGGSPEDIAEAKNLMQLSDDGQIEKIVDEVIAKNSKAASDVARGEMKAVGFLVGQVMKTTGGKANPAIVQNMLRDKLKEGK